MRYFWGLMLSVAISACGGGGGGGSDSRDLSEYQNLRTLLSETHDFAQKSEFENQSDYESRTNEYASMMTGYHKTSRLITKYDAESQELRVSFIGSGLITNGNGEGPLISFFHRGWPYDGHRATRLEDGTNKKYYVILSMSGSDAEEVADQFYADYTFSFSGEDVRDMADSRTSGGGSITSYRIYNSKNGTEYPASGNATPTPESPRDEKELRYESTIRPLYLGHDEAAKKGQFESDAEYQIRLEQYAGSLVGYYIADFPTPAEYDAEAQELLVLLGMNNGTFTPIEDSSSEYDIKVENFQEYRHVERDSPSHGRPTWYYTAIPMDAAEAQRIIGGFRFSMDFYFTAENIKKHNSFRDPSFSSTFYWIYANTTNFRLINVVNGVDYTK